MRGRPPTPTAIKLLTGNPGKRPLPQREPRVTPSLPPCPASLGKEGRREWRRVGRLLVAVRVLTDLDRAVLAQYCGYWEQWLDAMAKLRAIGVIVKSPSGYPMQSPYLAVANQAARHMRACMSELGLTPSSRTRIDAAQDAGSDPAEDFLFGARRA